MVFTTVVYRYNTPSFDSHYGELHKTQPYRIYKQKTGRYFWLVNQKRWNSFSFDMATSRKFSIIYQTEQTLCTDKINFHYEKMKLKDNLHFLGGRELQWYWCTVRISSRKEPQKQDVALTLTLGRKTDVENTTL